MSKSRPPQRPGPRGQRRSQRSGNRPAGGKIADGGNLIWGRHAVAAALANRHRQILRIAATAEAEASIQDMLATLTADRRQQLPPVTRTDRDQLADACPADAIHQGVLLTVQPLPGLDLGHFLQNAPTPLLLLVLDQITDPRNVGAILRSAAAFGVDGVIAQDRHAPPESGTLARAASGGLDVVPLIRVGNLARALEQMKEAGVWLHGLDSDAAESLGAQPTPARLALVLGAEDSGLRRLTREACDALLRLPTQPPIASLNVSNAAAIAIFAARQGQQTTAA
jgi:23S rRNA (guanosine2251-2'-O)-methyltransferase